MKKDRNCGANMYPVYPMPQMMPQQMMQPQMMQPQMMQNQMMPQQMVMPQNNQTYISGSLDQQVNSMANQLNNLERRVSNLEGLVGTNNYNNSNFQMM